jgi:hypothetical protein
MASQPLQQPVVDIVGVARNNFIIELQIDVPPSTLLLLLMLCGGGGGIDNGGEAERGEEKCKNRRAVR